MLQHITDRKRVIREFLIIAAGYFTYFGVRGATEGQLDVALTNAQSIVRLEEALGLFVEPALQAWVITDRWTANFANWVYLWGHWPVMGIVAFWLFRNREYGYRLYRNAILVSGAIGLLLFMFFPVAPPRMTDFGFFDTVTAYSNLYHVLQPAWLTNQLAAFPSLHFGWNLLIGIALFRESNNRAARLFGIAGPLLMFTAIVLTANHYIIDALGGGVVALIGLAIATKITSRGQDSSISADPDAAGPMTGDAVRRGVARIGRSLLPASSRVRSDYSFGEQRPVREPLSALDRVAAKDAGVLLDVID